MDLYISFWLTTGAILGVCIGWVIHVWYIRRYLKKHLPEHPEYKMYLDVLEGKTETDKKD